MGSCLRVPAIGYDRKIFLINISLLFSAERSGGGGVAADCGVEGLSGGGERAFLAEELCLSACAGDE